MSNYFSWEKVWKKYPKYKKVPLQVVLTERNVGKTYGTYFYYNKEQTFTPDSKVLILRNTDKELQKTKRDFANRYKNKLIVKGDFVYNLKFKEMVNKEGETITISTADEVVGYFASINNYINYKSIEAKDIEYIMYEEFNEDTVIGRNIYFKFFNILKTFERFNKIKYIFMLGNKDGFDSDFFINWNILPSDDKTKNKISEVKDEYGIIGVVYDFGSNEFALLPNSKTISSRLAAFDNKTNNYSLGGYLKQHCQRVMNYKKIVPYFNPKFYISIEHDKYIFGDFGNSYAILAPWNFSSDLQLVNYSFDVLSGLIKDSIILDLETHIELLDYIYRLEKNNSIYYDSYDTKGIVEDLIFTHKKYLQKK